METIDTVKVAFVVLFTLTAAVWDFRTKKLPNWLTVPGFAAALLFHIVAGAIADGWWGALGGLGGAMAGFAVGFGILLVLWLIGGGGAGDVKLMGALGAWFGAKQTLILFLVSTLFVLALSVGALAWQIINRGMWNTKRKYMTSPPGRGKNDRGLSDDDLKMRHKARRRLLPYGVPVAMAAWVVLLWSLRDQLFG